MNKIYINGNVITVDKKNPRCQAFSVEDGIFSSVGDNESVLKLRTEESQVIDLQGKTVVPGFNDCHTHLLNFAYSLNTVNLEGLNSE